MKKFKKALRISYIILASVLIGTAELSAQELVRSTWGAAYTGDIEVTLHDTYREVALACLGKGTDNVAACAVRYSFKNTCFINVVRPLSWNDEKALCELGHEMMHCLGYTHVEAAGCNK